jgi:hypothetical protein
MSKFIQKEVFSFKELIELNAKGTEKVRYKLIQWNTENHILTENAFEYVWKEALNQIGFINPKLEFSGFGSQGDGASFTCEWFECKKLIEFFTTDIQPSKTIALSKRNEHEEDFFPWIVEQIGSQFDPEFSGIDFEINGKVKRNNSRYVHENSCEVELEYIDELTESQLQLFHQFETSVNELRIQLCKAIYHSLEEENDALSTDESLIDLDEANEYQWDINGNQEKSN